MAMTMNKTAGRWIMVFIVVWCECGLTKKAEPPPTRDVNRDSGTASANGGWLRRLVRPHGYDWRSLNARMLLCSGSRRHEVRHKNEKQQTIDNDADNGWCEDALLAVLGNAEQGNDTKNQTDDDKQ